ncbi:MAG: hypothetical protein PHR16_15960 [Methylovulum sp.]|nr:hypothetical protein [Methylovulum sp.]
MKKWYLLVLLIIVTGISGQCLADASSLQQCAQRSQGQATGSYFSRHVFGANMLFFTEPDTLRKQPDYQTMLKPLGLGNLRFPGGTVADNYHWASGKVDDPTRRPVGHVGSAEDLGFDEFMALANSMAAEPSIVLNYLSWVEKDRLQQGFDEAASWVKYANLQKGYGVKFWEFGNEVFAYVPSKHITVKVADYARDYKAMKKILRGIDPTIQLGAAMHHKLHFTAKGDNRQWWGTFLREAGDEVDYLVVHNYPALTVDDYVSGGTPYPDLLQKIKAEVKMATGRDIPIHITEWNIALTDGDGKQGLISRDSNWQGLFIAEALLDFSLADVRMATFWPLRSEKGAGLLSNDDKHYFISGDVFKLLAPYEDSTIVFDCHDQTTRMAMLSGNGTNGNGGLIVVNRGAQPQTLDLQSVMGKNARLAGLSTLTAEGQGYAVKNHSASDLEKLNAKAAVYSLPPGSLSVFKLSH